MDVEPFEPWSRTQRWRFNFVALEGQTRFEENHANVNSANATQHEIHVGLVNEFALRLRVVSSRCVFFEEFASCSDSFPSRKVQLNGFYSIATRVNSIALTQLLQALEAFPEPTRNPKLPSKASAFGISCCVAFEEFTLAW